MVRNSRVTYASRYRRGWYDLGVQDFLVRVRRPLLIGGGFLALFGLITLGLSAFRRSTPLEDYLVRRDLPNRYSYGQQDLFSMIASLGPFRVGALVLVAVGLVLFVAGAWARYRTRDIPGPEDLD